MAQIDDIACKILRNLDLASRSRSQLSLVLSPAFALCSPLSALCPSRVWRSLLRGSRCRACLCHFALRFFPPAACGEAFYAGLVVVPAPCHFALRPSLFAQAIFSLCGNHRQPCNLSSTFYFLSQPLRHRPAFRCRPARGNAILKQRSHTSL